jgi:predicted enzyme related to lactoylglutathione lyase
VGKPVLHFEIGCKDSPATQKFYTQMFDWKIEMYGPTAMINTGSQAGIHGHITALGHEPHNYVLFYVEVDDLQAYLDKAAKLGGKTMIPPTPVPGMGEFAWFTDPEGTVVGLWKAAPK